MPHCYHTDSLQQCSIFYLTPYQKESQMLILKLTSFINIEGIFIQIIKNCIYNCFNKLNSQNEIMLNKSLNLILSEITNGLWPSSSLIYAYCEEKVIRLANQNREAVDKKLNSSIIQIMSSLKKQEQRQIILPLLYEFLSIMLINISNLNLEHFKQLEDRILDSTKGQDIDFQSKALQIQTQHIKQYFNNLLNYPFWKHIFSHQLNYPQFNILIETLQYLSLKYKCSLSYSLQNPYFIQIEPNTIQNINQIIFNPHQNIIQLLNHNIHLESLLKIIIANYTTNNRKMFRNTQITGKQLIYQLIAKIIKNSTINYIFSQDHASSSMQFQFFLNFMWNQHTQLAINFAQKYIINHNHQSLDSISTYIAQIPSLHYQFQILISHIYKLLIVQHGSANSFELMKKFLLNRFFLNINRISVFYQWKHEEITKYAKISNQIRELFYQQKKSGSTRLLHQFQKLLSNQIISQNCQSKVKAYIPDRVIELCYIRLDRDMAKQQSISFSLRNDSIIPNLVISKPITITKPKSTTQSSQRKNNLMMQQTDNSIDVSHLPIQNQTKRQQVSIHKSEEEILKELIQIRQIYANRSLQIQSHFQQKAQKLKTKRMFFRQLNEQIIKWKEQMQQNSVKFNLNNLQLL